MSPRHFAKIRKNLHLGKQEEKSLYNKGVKPIADFPPPDYWLNSFTSLISQFLIMILSGFSGFFFLSFPTSHHQVSHRGSYKQ